MVVSGTTASEWETDDMTAVPSYTVLCDGCRDADTPNADLGAHTAADARSEARRQGWVNRGALDFCPECVSDGTMAATLLRRRLARGGH